jgi:hypothetical protein
MIQRPIRGSQFKEKGPTPFSFLQRVDEADECRTEALRIKVDIR